MKSVIYMFVVVGVNHITKKMSAQGMAEVNKYSCIDIYSYSCFYPLSNEQKSMLKSGDSHAV